MICLLHYVMLFMFVVLILLIVFADEEPLHEIADFINIILEHMARAVPFVSKFVTELLLSEPILCDCTF